MYFCFSAVYASLERGIALIQAAHRHPPGLFALASLSGDGKEMDGSTFRIFGTVIRRFSSGAGRERSNSQLPSLAFSAAFSRSKFNIFVTEGGLLESDLASLVEVTSTSLFGRYHTDVPILALGCAGSCTQKVARHHLILGKWITMTGRMVLLRRCFLGRKSVNVHVHKKLVEHVH